MNNEPKGQKPQKKTRAYSDKFKEAQQEMILTMLMSDPEAFRAVRHILKEEYFDSKFQRPAAALIEHFETYGVMPSVEQIKAKCGADLRKFSEANQSPMHQPALLKEVEAFCQYKAMELAVVEGTELLQTGRPEEIVSRTQEALTISLEAEADPYTSLWIDETQDVPPPVFLIKPWLVKDTVTCVFGAPGSFKSFFCLEAAFSLATNTPFAGHPVEQTSVAYIAAEGQSGIALRIEALKEHHGIKPDGKSMKIIAQPINLLDEADVSKLIAYLKRLEAEHSIKFGVVFLDTYSQCIAGADENSAQVASAASASMIRIRRELGTTVVYVHHTGKDRARGMRGSDALRANTDGAIEVYRDEKAMKAVATVERHKDAPIGAKIDFSMKVVRVPHLAGRDMDTSLVCEFGAAHDMDGAKTPNDRMIERSTLRSILNVMKAGDEWSVGKVARLIGMHDNPRYKSKLVDLMPLDQEIEVRDNGGVVQGIVVRKSAAIPTNAFGVVLCIDKFNSEIQTTGFLQ